MRLKEDSFETVSRLIVGLAFEEFNNNFDMFVFASWEFLRNSYPNLTLEKFVSVNKSVKQTIERMAQSRSIFMTQLDLSDRIDIWPERLIKYKR